jgi:hypothetical protein
MDLAGARGYYSSAVLLHEGKDVGQVDRPRLLLARQHKTNGHRERHEPINLLERTLAVRRDVETALSAGRSPTSAQTDAQRFSDRT